MEVRHAESSYRTGLRWSRRVGLLRSLPCAVPGEIGLIEPEIAFVIAHDLPPRATPYTDAEIRAAIGEARMVLEFITTHYADSLRHALLRFWRTPTAITRLFIGPVIPNVLDHPLERLHVTIRTAAGPLFDKSSSPSQRPSPEGPRLAGAFPQ